MCVEFGAGLGNRVHLLPRPTGFPIVMYGVWLITDAICSISMGVTPLHKFLRQLLQIYSYFSMHGTFSLVIHPISGFRLVRFSTGAFPHLHVLQTTLFDIFKDTFTSSHCVCGCVYQRRPNWFEVAYLPFLPTYRLWATSRRHREDVTKTSRITTANIRDDTILDLSPMSRKTLLCINQESTGGNSSTRW